MGRKSTLQEAARRSLKRIRQGSYQTRQTREQIFCQIIEDLTVIRRLPTTLSRISAADLMALVEHWKTQKISDATIGNRLSALRTINQLTQLKLTIPDNKALGLISRQLKYPVSPLIDNIQHVIDSIQHPLLRNIIAFEVYFGLTRKEAKSIKLMMIPTLAGEQLVIDKGIAQNHKTRSIPIVNETQQSVLATWKKLCGEIPGNSLSLLADTIAKAMAFELHLISIANDYLFRRHYAMERWATLCDSMSRKSAITTLMEEMGNSKPCYVLALAGVYPHE